MDNIYQKINNFLNIVIKKMFSINFFIFNNMLGKILNKNIINGIF